MHLSKDHKMSIREKKLLYKIIVDIAHYFNYLLQYMNVLLLE